MPKTSIEWTDYSWPVVNGCRRISAGCGTGRAGGCYAERLAATRLKHNDRYRGLAVMTDHGPQWTGETRLIEKELRAPLSIRKPSRIFVADMGDLFYDKVPFAAIDRVFAVMLLAPRHTYQILSKRPARVREYLAGSRYREINAAAWEIVGRDVLPDPRGEEPMPTLPWWIGTSVEDQRTADERIPELLRARELALFGDVAWVSYEPAIGPVHFDERWLVGAFDHCPEDSEQDGCAGCPGFNARGYDGDCRAVRGPALDWIVVGGESGPGARPFDLAWARSTIEQCRAAGVPAFVKQIGSGMRLHTHAHGRGAHVSDSDRETYVIVRDRKGGDPTDWPEDLRVREYPEMRSA